MLLLGVAPTSWGGAASTGPPEIVPPPGRTARQLAGDEAFWSEVRARFEHVPWRTNLVTVVRGVTTRDLQGQIAADNERLNAFRPRPSPDPAWRSRLRNKAAALIGAPATSVALLRNTTEGVGTVLGNWPLRPGDEILTSSAEHEHFYDLLAARASRDGILPRRFHIPAPAASLGEIVDAVEAAMTERTRLVMVCQVVLTGQVMPIRAIADAVHRRGAVLLVDGVLGLGHVETDVSAMDCDFYAAGFHKWGCGPRATAVFYARPGRVESLAPLFGAVEERDGRLSELWASPRMDKYESFGAHPDAHWLGLERAVDLLDSLGVAAIRARLFALTRRWRSRAQEIPGFRAAVALDPEHSAGLTAWELEGRPRLQVARSLREHGVLTGGTGPYAGFFGIPADQPRSLNIANTAIFTSPSDVDRLAEAIADVASGPTALL